MPDADVTFLQMAAVFGEWEARKISERTKAALGAAKARGVRLGWSDPVRRLGHSEASRKGAAINRAKAVQFAANTRPIIESIQKTGALTLDCIADALNARGVPTPRGARWHPTSVRRLLKTTLANG